MVQVKKQQGHQNVNCKETVNANVNDKYTDA
jgi:hypothetical protein